MMWIEFVLVYYRDTVICMHKLQWMWSQQTDTLLVSVAIENVTVRQMVFSVR